MATVIRRGPARRVHSPHRRNLPVGNAHVLGVGNRGEGAGRLAPGHKDVHIGVNVPPEILGRGGLEYAAAKTGLSEIRNQIILEVTERGIPDNLGVAALEAASKSGVRIALDDVTLSGTNLAILSRCTLDVIKTDRSLVDQITPECPCPAWLSGLSALLQSTRVAVIAEGVETEAQAEALRAAGIPMAQGFYFSPPIPAEELKAYYSRAGGQTE